MWEIKPAAGSNWRGSVRLGAREVAIDGIEGISLLETSTKPFQGLLLAGLLFLLLASVLAYMIFEQGMNIRYLVGSLFLGFLGVCSVGEALAAKTQHLFEMQLVLCDGEVVLFTSTDREDIETLALTLTHARAQRG
jgi:hypothetical protein